MTDVFDLSKEAEQELNKAQNKAKKQFADKQPSNPTIKDVDNLIQADIIRLFHDQNLKSWVQYKDGNKTKVIPVKSKSFNAFVNCRVYEIVGVPQPHFTEKLITLYDSMAQREEKIILKLRNSWSKEQELLFQIDEISYVIISKEEIKVDFIEEPIFMNLDQQLPRNVDLKVEESLDELMKDLFINMEKDDYELFLDTLPACLIPNIAKPIDHITSSPGGGKSFGHKFKKAVLDPTISAEGEDIAKANDKDLIVLCSQHSYVFFDNINYLSVQQQDKISKTTTGYSSTFRELYTDDNPITKTIKLQVGVNGVKINNLQSDYVDRALFWNFRRLEDNERKPEEELKRLINERLPKIRGACIKILQNALSITTDYKPNFRLGDFAYWSVKCALARGRSIEEIKESWENKLAEQKDEGLEQSKIAEPFIDWWNEYKENHNDWEGTATELMETVTKSQYYKIISSGTLQEEKIIDKSKIPSDFPKNVNAFGKELEYIKHVLKRENIYISKIKSTGGKRIVKISKTPVTVALLPLIDEKTSGKKENVVATIEGVATKSGKSDKRVAREKDVLPLPSIDDKHTESGKSDKRNPPRVSTEYEDINKKLIVNHIKDHSKKYKQPMPKAELLSKLQCDWATLKPLIDSMKEQAEVWEPIIDNYEVLE